MSQQQQQQPSLGNNNPYVRSPTPGRIMSPNHGGGVYGGSRMQGSPRAPMGHASPFRYSTSFIHREYPNTTAPSQPPQQQQTKEINTATVCRIGQETVQEIVSRIQDVFSYLKSLQPPVGSNFQDRDRQTLEKQQKRLQEVLKGIVQLFKRLKVCWEKCQENTLGMEYTQMEALIPIKDERDIKAELEKKRGESFRQAFDEHNELSQQLVMRNRHIKEIIDQMRNIIWEINTMLAMRDE
ncbi:MED30 [Lepeophtheirus salmonis]|uniref:Mediator of RNA polymerase II transcription subunit 30 n=1 Tax=Lepeophtheirus salmonis TaxID=72036 RepID=A0A7R8CG47_LEPSM|nr:MED30 [Lepeophtheirus salmonis]CAF2812531.1 MED30 [Lepeophtheirus salmonis]